MNQAVIAPELFEAIEAYVLGTMPARERLEFERQLATDPGRKEEVNMHRQFIMAVEMAGVERTLAQIANEQTGKAQRSSGANWQGWLKYAAMVSVLVFGTLWWMGRPSQNEQLFAQYHVPDPGLPVPMSAVNAPDFQDAMVAYKLGDLEEASAKWGKLLLREPGNDTLLFYVAQAELQLGNIEAAMQGLQAVAADTSSGFKDKARWYLFLAYLKMGDREAMHNMAMDQDSIYGHRVREIEAKLR